MNNETELKPCPFCGGESVLAENYNDFFYTGCCDCGASHEPTYCGMSNTYRKDGLLKVWNTRPIEDAKDAQIADLEQQLAEARRDNLRQRVEDILLCDIDNQCHSVAVNIVSRLCTSKQGTFRDATDAIKLILLHNQQKDMAITRQKVYDWLIEQGAEGKG